MKRDSKVCYNRFLFQINGFFLFNSAKMHHVSTIFHHVRMISESCDLEDWSNDITGMFTF